MWLPFVLASLLLSLQKPADQIRQLRDPDPVVRLKAAKTLGDNGESSKDAIPALKRAAAEDADEDVRLIAKQAIKKIEQAIKQRTDDDVIKPLVNSLRFGNAPSKANALEKISKLGTSAEGASEAIIAALSDPSRMVRERALSALESVNPTLYPAAVTLLVDKNPAKKNDALMQIENLGEKGRPMAPFLASMLVNMPGGEHQMDYIHVIDFLDGNAPELPEFSAALLNLIRPRRNRAGGFSFAASRPELRVRAIHAIYKQSNLGMIDRKKSTRAYIEAISAEHDIPVLNLLLLACGNTGPEAKEALPTLRKFKLHPNQETRQIATDSIEKIETPESKKC